MRFIKPIMSFLRRRYGSFLRMLDAIYKKINERECKRCIFDNRKKDSENLLIIVAGYQEYLWEIIFDRIRKHAPADFDVCICVPGAVGEKRIDKLRDIASNNNWSFVQTKANRLALTQNAAVLLHDKAKWIYKLDEDIFIGDSYFDILKNTYLDVYDKSPFIPGPVFPVISVNGHTSEYFVNYLGNDELISDIKKHLKVDVLKRKSLGVFWSDEYVARMIWEASPKIDECVEMFKKNEEEYIVAPFGVQIGAFLISRDFYEEIKGFKLAPEGELGVEERAMWAQSSILSRPMIIATRAFAGHFGFMGQKAHVKELFDEKRELFY